MSKTKGFLLAVAFAAMAFTFSCSSDDGDGGGNSPGGGGDSNLVCAEGEAWHCSANGDIFVFRSNGEILMADGSCGAYCLDKKFTWSVSGNILTIGKETYPYSVSGDKLTLQDEDEEEDKTLVCTKRSNLPLIEK